MSSRPDRDCKALQRLESLYSKRKDQLKDIVKASYRIVDLRGVDKGTLVAMAMESEFGQEFPTYVDNGKKMRKLNKCPIKHKL